MLSKHGLELRGTNGLPDHYLCLLIELVEHHGRYLSLANLLVLTACACPGANHETEVLLCQYVDSLLNNGRVEMVSQHYDSDYLAAAGDEQRTPRIAMIERSIYHDVLYARATGIVSTVTGDVTDTQQRRGPVIKKRVAPRGH